MLLESKLAGEFLRPWFFGDPGIRSAFDGEAPRADGFDGATEAIRSFEERDVAGGGVIAMKDVSRGEAADASADDGDALLHGIGAAAIAFVESRARAACARSARAAVRVGESLRD